MCDNQSPIPTHERHGETGATDAVGFVLGPEKHHYSH